MACNLVLCFILLIWTLNASTQVGIIVLYIQASVLTDMQGASIVVTSNTGSTEWWLAYSISDATTSAVELSDTGEYLYMLDLILLIIS